MYILGLNAFHGDSLTFEREWLCPPREEHKPELIVKIVAPVGTLGEPAVPNRERPPHKSKFTYEIRAI